MVFCNDKSRNLENLSTKEKILYVARELFSEHGFEGTSIRDIAKIADVNVSSVNYHFENKENLFREINIKVCNTLFHHIEEVFNSQEWKFEDFTIEIFKLLISDSSDLVKNFKIFLSDSTAESFSVGNKMDEQLGPPGSTFLLQCLMKETDNKISFDDALWAIRITFSQICHQALILSTRYAKQEQIKQHLNAQSAEKSTRRLIKLILNDFNSVSDK
jgi:AcrR family transcriptional regulator